MHSAEVHNFGSIWAKRRRRDLAPAGPAHLPADRWFFFVQAEIHCSRAERRLGGRAITEADAAPARANGRTHSLSLAPLRCAPRPNPTHSCRPPQAAATSLLPPRQSPPRGGSSLKCFPPLCGSVSSDPLPALSLSGGLSWFGQRGEVVLARSCSRPRTTGCGRWIGCAGHQIYAGDLGRQVPRWRP